MHDEKKREQRGLNSGIAGNGGELKSFAQRNKVSMDEARAVLGQFGHDRPIAFENADPEARQPAKALASRRRAAKGKSLGDAQ